MRPSIMRRLHASIFWACVAVLPPTLTIWRESVVYLVFISWAAMAYGALTAWQQGRTEQRIDPLEPDP